MLVGGGKIKNRIAGKKVVEVDPPDSMDEEVEDGE